MHSLSPSLPPSLPTQQKVRELQKAQATVCYLQEQLEEAEHPSTSVEDLQEELRTREKDVQVCVCVCVCPTGLEMFFLCRRRRQSSTVCRINSLIFSTSCLRRPRLAQYTHTHTHTHTLLCLELKTPYISRT